MKKEDEEEIKELSKIYKFVNQCKICGRYYGSDKNDKHKICPICGIGNRKVNNISKFIRRRIE